MSGGSLNYACYKVNEIAEDVLRHADSNLHKAFGKHLLLVATALHDLEWVLSCDYGPGDETEAIRKVVSPVFEVETAKEEAAKLIAELNEVLTVIQVVK